MSRHLFVRSPLTSHHRGAPSIRVRWSPVALAVAAAIAAATSLPATAAAAAAETDALAEVTVTGSRIVRRDLEAASPVVTVTSQVFDESSTLAVESVLNQLPQFVPANTQFNTADVFPSATTTPGISTVNMRGLGTNRTLVLVDGRRAQPANSTLVIDTNSIPSSALESVEIISGGASAVYGADALAGVTNFKLRSNFQGVDMQFRTGITERGDGQESRVSLLLGSSLGDGRGNAMLGVEWTERDEVLAIDRPFYRNAFDDPAAGGGVNNGRLNGYSYEPVTALATPNAPGMSVADRNAYQAAANALFPNRPSYMPNVPIALQPGGAGYMFNPDGSLFRIEGPGIGFKGDVANDINYRITSANMLAQTNLDLRYSSPMTRYSLFGKANFEMNEFVEAFSSVNFVNSTNRQVLQPSGAVTGFAAQIPHGTAIYGPSLAADGTTLPEYQAGGSRGLNCPATGGCTNSQAFPVSPELASLLDARGANVYPFATAANPNPNRQFDPVTGVEIPVQGVNARWTLGITTGFLPPRTIENNTNLYQVLAGLRGNLGFGDWTWEAYFSHGETRTDLDYIGFVSTRRLQAVAQAPNYGRNATITSIASTTLTCTSGLPVFGNFEITQDCINAITATYTDRSRLSQDIIEATAQGGLFSLPAGELRGAFGVTSRKNDFQYLPDATREINNIVDMPVGSFGQANVRGETEVREIYGELLVPLLRDVIMAKSLELELGYRWSDYDTAGQVPTWKALFSWAPLDWMRFRGGYQLANRAPNINELFLEASSQAITLNTSDPCRSDTTATWGNHANNPNRAAAQSLCEAIIGNTTSEFTTGGPSNFVGGRTDGVMLQITSGSRSLQSEQGETWTVGTVLNSPFENAWLVGTSLAIDWYKAKITDAITQVSAQTTYDLCFNRFGNNPTYAFTDPNGVCQNIDRDEVSGAAQAVNSTYANTGSIETSGLDIQLNWRSQLADMGLQNAPGGLSLNLSFSKLFEFKAQEFAGGAVLENAGTLARGGLFDWRSVTTLRYTHADWGVGLNWRHLPSVKNALYVSDPNTLVQGAGSYDIFGLTAHWDITRWLGISGGVDNLFDRDPNRVGAGQVIPINAINGGGSTVLNAAGSTNAQYYDVLGRRYFLNVKLSF